MSSPAHGDRRAGGKRARTRAALAASALEVIAEKGLAAASLDEIAARVGMTKGAIYSNFAGKAELLLEAMRAKGLTFAADRPPAASLDEELERFADELVSTLQRARGEAAFLAEVQLQALGDPELRKGLADTYDASFTSTAAYLAGLVGPTPAMPPRDLAVALQSIALGFLIQSLITPEAVSEAIVRRTVAAFAAGLRSPGL